MSDCALKPSDIISSKRGAFSLLDLATIISSLLRTICSISHRRCTDPHFSHSHPARTKVIKGQPTSVNIPQYNPTKHSLFSPSYYILEQCSSRNPSSPSSLPSPWPLPSPPSPSPHATVLPSAPQASPHTVALKPFRSALWTRAPRLRSLALPPTWTRANRCVWVELLPRRKDGVFFPQSNFFPASHEMANAPL